MTKENQEKFQCPECDSKNIKFRFKVNTKDKNNPYNTYQIPGLPPTPISTISQSSLEAVILGMKNDYLYFVAKGDGTHKFSKTYKEHLEAVRKYQLN